MATATLKPGALSAIVTPSSGYGTSTGTLTDSWQLIDDITSDSDYITHDDTRGDFQWIVYDIGPLPADFAGADSSTTYTFRVRTYLTGYVNDGIVLTCRLISPNTTVTQGLNLNISSWAGAGGSSWTPRLTNGDFPSTFTTSTLSSFITADGEAASAADWANAKLAIAFEKNNQMGGDATQLFISGIEIDIIDYVQTASAPVLTLPVETPGITGGTVGCTTDTGTGTMYAYVSTSATAPSAADLKSGTGSVWSGSVVSPGAGTETFTIPSGTLTALTTYYSYFIQTDGTDSNILESGSWQTLDGSRTVACSTEALSLTETQGTVTTEITTVQIVPPPATLSITGQIPTFQSRAAKNHLRGRKPKWDRLNVQGLAPNFVNSLDNDSGGVTTTTAALAVTANTATITTNVPRTVTATTAAITITETAAVVALTRVVTGASEAVLVSTTQALAQTDREVAAVTEAIALGTNTAVVQLAREIVGVTQSLLVTETAAIVDAITGLLATCTTESLTLTENTAAVQTDRPVTGVTESLVFTETPASVEQARIVAAATEALVLTESAATVEALARQILSVVPSSFADGTTGVVITTQAINTATAQVYIMGDLQTITGTTANTITITTNQVDQGTGATTLSIVCN